MKIRTDYVTNSSSSSFIIARRNDCTKEDIKRMLQPVQSLIERDLKQKDCFKYYDSTFKGPYFDDDSVWESEDPKRLSHYLVDKMAEALADGYVGSIGTSLDGYDIIAGGASNDSFDLMETLIYNYLRPIDDDKFKVVL